MSELPVRRSAEAGAAVVAELVSRARGGHPLPAHRRSERKPELTALALAALGAGVRHWLDRPSGSVAVARPSRRARKRAVLLVPSVYAPNHVAGGAEPRRGSRRWLRRSMLGAALAVGFSKTRQILDENEPTPRAEALSRSSTSTR